MPSEALTIHVAKFDLRVAYHSLVILQLSIPLPPNVHAKCVSVLKTRELIPRQFARSTFFEKAIGWQLPAENASANLTPRLHKFGPPYRFGGPVYGTIGM